MKVIKTCYSEVSHFCFYFLQFPSSSLHLNFLQGFALPGLFPTINVPLAYRQNKFPYNDFGNASKGHDFLEKALKEQFWSGSDEGFLLHKELDILNPKGETVCKLSSDFTRPNHHRLHVIDEDASHWRVQLAKLPKRKKVEPQPLDKNETLSVYK